MGTEFQFCKTKGFVEATGVGALLLSCALENKVVTVTLCAFAITCKKSGVLKERAWQEEKSLTQLS